jgi:hypothetical protein
MKRTVWIALGGVLLVAVLAGAAFMAMRLLNVRTAGTNGLLPFGGIGGGKGPMMQSIRINMERAPELPEQEADFAGQVTGIQDNSIFVAPMNKGGVTYSSGQGDGERIVQAPTPSGPSTEVVITKETKVYRDVSMKDIPKPSANSGSQEVKIQQKVEPATLAEATTDSFVQVWGQKRGERLIADVVVIMGPAVMIKKR